VRCGLPFPWLLLVGFPWRFVGGFPLSGGVWVRGAHVLLAFASSPPPAKLWRHLPWVVWGFGSPFGRSFTPLHPRGVLLSCSALLHFLSGFTPSSPLGLQPSTSNTKVFPLGVVAKLFALNLDPFPKIGLWFWLNAISLAPNLFSFGLP